MRQRDTEQRRAIREALEEADRPLAAEQIREAAARRCASIGIATVYRAVRAGLDAGWLCVVEVPGLGNHYEVASKGHHHHFACRACGGVFDIAGCPGNLEALLPRGFRLEDHDVLLHGLCEGCNA